jgi:hypothetical protein
MYLKIKFGLNGKEKTLSWYQKIEDFPKLLRFEGKKWEWIVYNAIGGGDYELVYSEIPTYDPSFYIDMPSFEELFPGNEQKCECGAHFSSFSWDHFRYCSKWRPW